MGAGVTDTDAIPDPSSTRRPRRVRRGPDPLRRDRRGRGRVVAQERGSSSSTSEPEAVGDRGACRSSVPPADAVSSAVVLRGRHVEARRPRRRDRDRRQPRRPRVDATITVMPGGDAPPESDSSRSSRAGDPGPGRRHRGDPRARRGRRGLGGPAVVSHELAARRRPRGRAVRARRRRPTGTSRPGRPSTGRQQICSRSSTPSATTPSSTSGSSPTPACRSPTSCRRSWSRAGRASRSRSRTASCARARRDARARAPRAHRRRAHADLRRHRVRRRSARQGIAVSLGAESPALAWAVTAGTTPNGGIAVLSLANFSNDDARVDVRCVVVGNRRSSRRRSGSRRVRSSQST